MCGIFGYRGKSFSLDNALMYELLSHRGPDAKGIFKHRDLTFIHTRLSIIDINDRSNQPFYSKDGNLVLIFNGEIYNYRDIKKILVTKGYNFLTESDTEVVLHSYQEWGHRCLEKFNGMFAFAIYNKSNGKIFMARDRLGIKPLYYFHHKKDFVFSSEIKPIVSTIGFVPKLSKMNICYAINNSWIPEPYTAFNDIFLLEPGHFAVFMDNKLTIQKYWSIELENTQIGEETASDEFYNLMSDSIERRLISDVPVGVFFSGGIDSAIITKKMQEKIGENMTAYTVSFDAEDSGLEFSGQDGYYAKKFCEENGIKQKIFNVKPDILENLEKTISSIEDPIADPAAINVHLMTKEAKKTSTVILSGIGADEVHSGYFRHRAIELKNKFPKNPFEKIKNIHNPLLKSLIKINRGVFSRYGNSHKYLESLSQGSNLDTFVDSYSMYSKNDRKKIFKPYNQFNNYLKLSHAKHIINHKDKGLNKYLYLDSKYFLSSLNLRYTDKASMANSVEVRVPFIDHNILDYLFRLPYNYKSQKRLLKKSFKRDLPNYILNRRKGSFKLPLRSWMENCLDNELERYFSRSNPNLEFLNHYEFKKIYDNFQNGKSIDPLKIWNYYYVCKWNESFRDKCEKLIS